MKKAAVLTALGGLIFAGITTTCYAAPNWARFLPRPIVIPVDSSSVSNDITIAAIDFRKFLPRPIVIPVDSVEFSGPIELASSYQGGIIICKKSKTGPSIPPTPIDRRTLTSYQDEIIICKKAITGPSIPPTPIDRKTLTA
ncbi:MAG: hypothetical protein KJ620_05985 [Candidatus Edwardsbacteria bacterium]|nr:hypothetical protein [Candidatus Edwardsbacteria bacterium]MBU1575852.1 hypothetical protein [Candidatus Edwardsbacteria bacterium]MBU2463638.1 hypothetical protein [Candidatus Edwardsbacteria bacterium]MBU2593066.1 hypothetical protein [Candidatus Edwardsbacteria bacterium]